MVQVATQAYQEGWERIFGGQSIQCEACPEKKEPASIQYTYSNGLARENKSRSIPPSFLCEGHGKIFKRFAGSVTKLLQKENTLCN